MSKRFKKKKHSLQDMFIKFGENNMRPMFIQYKKNKFNIILLIFFKY